MTTEHILTIMVVDDNRSMRTVIKDSLAGLPCTFVECENGEEAVAAYGRTPADWVLMDVMMQPMNGLDALARIRRMDPAAKVIMVTNAVEDSVSNASFRAGALAFVRKESLTDLLPLITRDTGESQ